MKFNGIAASLAQLLLLLLVPFVALAVAFSVRVNRELEQHARAEVQSFSAVAAARVEDQLQSADGILRSVALVASSWRETTADLDTTLRTLASDLPFFTQDVSVFDTLGDVVATSLERTPAVQRLNVADRDYFRTALQSPHLVIGRAAVGRATGVWSLPLAHRILRDGRVVGVVVATPRLRHIGAYLSTNALTPESMITIVDSGGVVLARNHDPDQWVGTSIRALRHVSTILGSRDSSSALEPAFDGTVGYLGWTRVRRAPWVVMIGIEEASDARALRAQQRLTLSILALVFMAVLGFAWRLGRRVARPMQHLATVASQLGMGNLGTRAHVSGVDEVRELAVAFNSMADALERQARLLQHSNEELATLVAASPWRSSRSTAWGAYGRGTRRRSACLGGRPVRCWPVPFPEVSNRC